MEKKPKVGANRNRRAGHKFELLIVEKLREIGFDKVITTRAGSRTRDGQKVDIMNADEAENGRLPYNIQCKLSAKLVKYNDVLKSMPVSTQQMNVVLHKYAPRSTGRKSKGQIFVPVGTYAILDANDFLKLISTLLKLQSDKNNVL